MSRRKERAWQEHWNGIIARCTYGGGEMLHTDWGSVATEIGLMPDDFRQPGGYGEDDDDLDIEAIEQTAKELFFHPHGRWPALVVITLKCQRCNRRIDTWRLRAGTWQAATSQEPGGYQLTGAEITSEAWARDIGDSTAELLRKFEGRSLRMTCVCGRQDLQFSVRRLRETIERLSPTDPTWAQHNGDEYVSRSMTRRATIHG